MLEPTSPRPGAVPWALAVPYVLIPFRAVTHIAVGGLYQFRECRRIDFTFRPQLHVAHELAVAFQQACWIPNLGAAKESDIDVCPEGVDVAERRITHTRGWM